MGTGHFLCVCVHLSGGRRLTSGVSVSCWAPCVLRQGLSLSLELADSALLESPREPLVSVSTT